jgi:DMSO/TMAO reductase YedYZ molybdopterin-dependent catalytic subunit
LWLFVVGFSADLAANTAQYETRRVPVGSAAIVLAGIAACAAVLSRAGATVTDIVPTVVGTACGVAVLRLLTSGRFTDEPEEPDAETAADAPDRGRRLSLVTLGFLGAGVLTGVGGAVLSRLTTSVAGDRNAFALPKIDVAAPAVPPTVQPQGVALPSFVTGNDDFYRIDTALSVPQLSRADWELKIHGMVDREITYRFDDLERFEVVEKLVTLTCVSNPVGGDLIGNAAWTGYRIRDLLAEAGIHSDADMVLSTSIDGFTAGSPVEALTDGRDSLLAIGMNGQPLPTEHGYPARLVVPGLYGYVSATKWVVDLELTRFDRAQGYWTPLGWSARGPIKTESRIDVPRSGADVAQGPVTFGGVAWAQNRGVRAVEVRIDEGDWEPADLGANYANDTWRLWSFPWQATQPGSHTISVRATDNTGAVQTADLADPVPDGATGWHTVSFAVK